MKAIIDSMCSEAQLWKATGEGGRDAFDRLVRRYQMWICSIGYSDKGNVRMAEAVAQETFLAARSQRAELRDHEKVRGWMPAITRDAATELRARRVGRRSR